MRRNILILSLLFSIATVYTQEKVLELPESFSTSYQSSKESYAVPNQENGELMLLLEEKNKFYSYLLNSEYQQQSKITTKTLPSKYRSILGYSINNNIYSIFFSNSRNTKFGVQTFDFGTNSSTSTILDFKIKGEKYVETINYKNQFYLITITKNSSDLNFYTFNKDYQPQKKVVSLQQIEYQNPRDKYHTINAHYLLIADAGGISSSIIEIGKIEAKNPNIIETTSKLTKLYQFNNQLIFSFDYSKKETKLCFIDLDNFQFTYKTFDKPSKEEKGFTGSNSYIYDNKLFQIASSYQKMKFLISDLTSGKLIKEYAIQKEDSITFKNSPIIQEGGVNFFGIANEDRVREMEKTAKFLRKISNSNIGISAYKVNDKYNIVLGGTKEIPSGGVGFAPGFGGGMPITTSSSAILVGFNPTFYGYGGYTSTKSTYINCLFDENFEHQQGDIPKNVFDKINDFEDTLKKPIAKNIFLHNNNIHFSYYDKNDKLYKLYRFKE